MILKPIARRISLAGWYNAINAQRGFGLAPHHYPIIAGLEDHRIDNFLVLGPPGLGKSNLLCSVYPSWELGHDPSLTIISVSAGEKLPQGFMSATMQIIQHDPTWARMFPDVRPAPEQGWSIQRGLFVRGHHAADSDASYVSVGLQSKALTGLHARLHIYDDLHDRENSATPDGRRAVIRTFYDTLAGRADPRGARRVAAGRWWAEDDLYQEWIAGGDWVVLQLPASRPGNVRLWYDVFLPKDDDGRPRRNIFSETLEEDSEQDPNSRYIRYRAYYGAVDLTKKGFYWPASPSKRQEYETVKRRQPRTAAINYDGDVAGGLDGIFRESDFVPFLSPVDLSLGRASPGIAEWINKLHGTVKQAWDTAHGQSMSESKTVALTGLLVPCQSWHCGEDASLIGECDFHFDVFLLDVLVKDIDFRELALALREQHGLWHPDEVIVEEKQSGISLLQTFKGSHIPLKGQKIEQGKVERAVNPVTAEAMGTGASIPGGAASVQGWGRMGRIRYPMGAPWITHGPPPESDPEKGFIKQVLKFRGGVRGSDEFDALVHLVTRAIIRSRRHGRIGVAAPFDDVMVASPEVTEDPRRMVLEGIGALPGLAMVQESPWSSLCGAPCAHYGIISNREWCSLHGRQTSAIGGCQSWTQKEKAA